MVGKVERGSIFRTYEKLRYNGDQQLHVGLTICYGFYKITAVGDGVAIYPRAGRPADQPKPLQFVVEPPAEGYNKSIITMAQVSREATEVMIWTKE